MTWNVGRRLLCLSSSSPSNFAGQKQRSSKEIHLQNPKTGSWEKMGEAYLISIQYSMCHLWSWQTCTMTFWHVQSFSCFHARPAQSLANRPGPFSPLSAQSMAVACCEAKVKSPGNYPVELFSRVFVERFTTLWWTKYLETKSTKGSNANIYLPTHQRRDSMRHFSAPPRDLPFRRP